MSRLEVLTAGGEKLTFYDSYFEKESGYNRDESLKNKEDAMKKSRRIGLVLQSFGEQLGRLKAGIQAYAHRQGYWRLVETSRMDERHIRAVTSDVEGVIAHVADKRYAKMITSGGVPCVNVSEPLRDAYFPTVRTDDALVGRHAAEYFLQRGYRHYAFLGSSLGPMPKRRQVAFVGKVQQAGFEASVFSIQRSLDLPKIRREIGRWLTKLTGPVALMASTDSLGLTALDACAEFGLAVPQAVAVLGVGNIHSINRYSNPALSSISTNLVARGFAAAQLLDGLMAGKPGLKRLVMIPPGRIITRQSSDALAIDDELTAAALKFIYEHACDPVSVLDVARAVGINRRSLERRFQEVLGTSPHHEIRRVRMDRAQRLLTETAMSIAEVAVVSGMGSTEYLWNAFDQTLGQSPSAYRKAARHEEEG